MEIVLWVKLFPHQNIDVLFPRTLECDLTGRLSLYKGNQVKTRSLVWALVHKTQFSHTVLSDSCDPMDCSMPGFPVHHQLPELAQIHVYWVSDAIQPSHLLSSPSSPASIFPSIRVFSNESVLRIRWPKYWNFSFSINPSIEYSGLISFKIDWFDFFAVQGRRFYRSDDEGASGTGDLRSLEALHWFRLCSAAGCCQ